jgi:hypothetical protein
VDGVNAPVRTDPWDEQRQPDALVQKAAAAVTLVDELRAEIARLHASHALARAEMSQAVIAVFAERAARLADRRAAAIAARETHAAKRPGWPSRMAWRRRATLMRFGRVGQILVVLASGVWRRSGRPIYDLRHIGAYLRRGADPTVVPPSLFDQAFYLDRNPDVAARGVAPLLHFLLAGRLEGREPHQLFDSAFYARENAQALEASGLWPLAHFMRQGGQGGGDPHPLFDMAHYLAQEPALAPGEDPLSHYVREGWRLGLSPHPLFDPAWYQAQMPASAAQIPPLVHFVLEGAAAGLSPHRLFDPAWYLAQVADTKEAVGNPLCHYLAVGAGQDLSPNPCFDPQHYVARRGDAPPREANPLIDYLLRGAWTVADPAPGFAMLAYVAAHPDLVSLGLTPLEHWVRLSADQRLHD